MVQIIILLLLSGLSRGQADSVRVHKQGTVDITDMHAVDIDEGASWTRVEVDGPPPVIPELTSFKGSDFMFMVVGKKFYLVLQHKAQAAIGIPAGKGYAGCAAATFVKGKVRIDNLPSTTVICIHTDQGRFAEIRVEKYEPEYKNLAFSYTTWEKENAVPVKK
jgi:hypothetical protein